MLVACFQVDLVERITEDSRATNQLQQTTKKNKNKNKKKQIKQDFQLLRCTNMSTEDTHIQRKESIINIGVIV
jgi:hypothetical protein